MYFKFSRERHPSYFVEGFGDLTGWHVYRVVQDQGWSGNFYYHPKICYFEYEDKEFGIMPKRSIGVAYRSRIVDRKTDRIVGEIRGKGKGQDQTGEIQLADGTYIGKKVPQEIYLSSFFKPGTWNNHEYTISNDRIEVAYSFRTSIFLPTISPLKEGFISMEGDNLVLLFAGIFLIQERLDLDSRE